MIEVSNGQDMVKLCQERKPDIAFVDIKMPYMNGLDAIEKSKESSEATEYVIISGYSDFEYAQRGIRLGVNEYLLKPADEEQLRKVAGKLKEKLKLRKRESNSRFQLRVMEAFNNYLTVGKTGIEQEPSENKYGYLGFIIYVKTNTQTHSQSMASQRELIELIRKSGDDVVARKGYYAISITGEGFPCVIFAGDDELKSYIISSMKKNIMAVKEKNNKIFQYAMYFKKDTLEEVYQVCEKMDAEAYMGMNYSSGKVYEYQESRFGSKEREFLKMVEQLLNAWESADGMACNEIMNHLWRRYKDETLDVDLVNISRYCSFITCVNIVGDSLKLFCESFVKQSDLMYGNVVREESDMIEQVKKYIQKHYMNDISISQIADHFELTANYLSTIFHRKTGDKFIDYLTRVRMEAAKKLLIQNLSASVQDIALMVGYNSARHFSALFQKTTGETPTSYRKSQS